MYHYTFFVWLSYVSSRTPVILLMFTSIFIHFEAPLKFIFWELPWLFSSQDLAKSISLLRIVINVTLKSQIIQSVGASGSE